MTKTDRKQLEITFAPPLPAFLVGLFHKGVSLPARVPMSLDRFLGEELGLDEEAVARAATVFLDGHPVDDSAQAMVEDGACLALGTAMPGLVGIAMRKGSPVGGFRSSITCPPSTKTTSSLAHCLGPGLVTVRLFNFLAREIGPALLAKGILTTGDTLLEAFPDAGTDPLLLIHLEGEALSTGTLRSELGRLGREPILFRGLPGNDEERHSEQERPHG